MLIVTDRIWSYVDREVLNSSILQEAEVDFSEAAIVTSKKEVYKNFAGDKFFGLVQTRFPNSIMEIGYFDADLISDDGIKGMIALQASRSCTEGFVLSGVENNLPHTFVKFFNLMHSVKKRQLEIEDIKKRNETKERKFKEQKAAHKDSVKKIRELDEKRHKAWKEICKEIKKENKEAKEAFQKAYKKADDDMRAFIQEPAEKPFPEEPIKSELPDKPEEPKKELTPMKLTFRGECADFWLSWRFIKNHTILKVKDSNLYYFKKRATPLVFATNEILSADKNGLIQGEIEREEFVEIIRRKAGKKLPSYEKLEQPASSASVIDFISEVDESHMNFVFEENVADEKILPPLDEIKPSQSASIIASGAGNVFKEVELNGERVIMKFAMVKTASKRTVVKNGDKTEIVVHQQVLFAGIYNTNTLELKMLSGED